ncbi:MAG: F0F1 ATP synthase subunit A [Firmicutes bacterium]|nr:F0F1 ATP synthase subunit A [Bacillota bacterium]
MEDLFDGPSIVFEFYGFQITETMLNIWLVMAVLIVLALLLRRNLELYPGKVQNVVEMVVEAFEGLVTSTMGDSRKDFMPYMAALFLFIGLSNMMGLLGLMPPTADVNTTIGLALLTFILIHYSGFRNKGFGHIRGLAQPVFLFLPINIISELAKPVSLAFRLFGNILGGTIIMAMITGAIALFVPVVPSLYFDVFSGLLQSFIFVMLTMVFITLAIE